MEYEFCDSSYGGYTAIARREFGSTFSMTTQISGETIYIQVCVGGEMHGFRVESENPTPGRREAQIVMLHYLSFGRDCECI